MVTKFGGQILATKFGFVPDWLLVLCEGNSPVTGEFPAQKASNVEKASIWWRYHVILSNKFCYLYGIKVCHRNLFQSL